MEQIVKYKLIFNRKKRKLKKGDKAKVSIEVYFSRNCRRFIPTKVSITQEQWNDKEKVVNSNHDNSRYLNNYLAEKIQGLKQFELELSVKGQVFSPESLEHYKRSVGEGYKLTFNSFIEEKRMEEKSASDGTQRGYRKALNKLNEYNSNISFSEVNYQFIKDFDNFMISHGLKINSRGHIHNVLKKFLNIAISCDILTIKDMPYNTLAGGGNGKFSIGSEPGTKIPLNFEELERFEKLEYPYSERYERWKDAFLFTCYTGLRNCDEKALNITHLVHTRQGYCIDLHKMIKTKRPVYLELFTLFDGKPEKILRKYLIKKYGTDNYESILKTGDTSAIFAGLHDSDFNTALKVMARDAKIQKKLTTHCGRHTFGTLMAILTNGNQYLIMDLLGHSKPTTTMIYVKLGERMVNRQLRNVNWNAYDSKPIANELQGKEEYTEQIDINEEQSTNDVESDIIEQFLSYIYSDIVPNIDFKAKEKIPLAIDKRTLKEYVETLPFSVEDMEKYSKEPFELDAYLIGMKNMPFLKGVENALNKVEWIKESCLKIKLKLLPMPLNHLKVIEI